MKSYYGADYFFFSVLAVENNRFEIIYLFHRLAYELTSDLYATASLCYCIV